MAQVDIYKIDGSKTETMELPDHLFGVPIKADVVSEALRIQNANARVAYAHAKDRSEVRGGGRKPWKQKGTGRARHGSRRSPIWVGGGITFGPLRWRNFSLKINKKAKRAALKSVLSDKVASGSFIVVESLDACTTTKAVVAMRKVLPGAEQSAVVICAPQNAQTSRATRNLLKTNSLAAHSLNVKDLLKHDVVIASKPAVDRMIELYA